MAKQHPPYRTAIIGVGRIGHSLGNDRLREQPASHSRAVNENPRLSLVAVTDTDPKKLAAFKKDFPAVKLYPGTDALFTAEKPDIVIVAVDTDQHAPVARTVLPFRPRLLVMEKPVAPNPHEAREIARTAAHYEVPVQINHERRFAGDYRLVKDLLSRGKIGELAAVRAHLWSGAPVWDKAAARTGDCSLLHDGTHLIDTLRFLLGKELKKPNIDFIKKKKDGSVSRLQAHEVVTGDVFISLEFAGDKKVFDFEITLEGTAGLIRIGNGFLKLYTRARSPYYSGFYSLTRERSVRRPETTGYFSNMVSNCVDFLDGNARLLSPLEEGIATLETLHRIAAQLS